MNLNSIDGVVFEIDLEKEEETRKTNPAQQPNQLSPARSPLSFSRARPSRPHSASAQLHPAPGPGGPGRLPPRPARLPLPTPWPSSQRRVGPLARPVLPSRCHADPTWRRTPACSTLTRPRPCATDRQGPRVRPVSLAVTPGRALLRPARAPLAPPLRRGPTPRPWPARQPAHPF